MQNILRQKRLFFTILAKNCSFLFHFFPRSVVSTAFAIASEVALLVPISTYFHRVSRVEKGRNTGGRRRAEEKSGEVHLSCHDYCWCYFYKQCFQPWTEYWNILKSEVCVFNPWLFQPLFYDSILMSVGNTEYHWHFNSFIMWKKMFLEKRKLLTFSWFLPLNQ